MPQLAVDAVHNTRQSVPACYSLGNYKSSVGAWASLPTTFEYLQHKKPPPTLAGVYTQLSYHAFPKRNAGASTKQLKSNTRTKKTHAGF